MSRRHRPFLSRRWRWYRRLWLRVVFPGADLSKRQQRMAAEHAFADVWFSPWYPWYLMAVVGAAYSGFMAAFMIFATAIIGNVQSLDMLVWALLLGLLLMVLMPVLAAAIVDGVLLLGLRLVIGRGVRRSIRRSGVDLCVACGYMLRGVPEQSPCPECGVQREVAA